MNERRFGARHTFELDVELHSRTDRIKLRALDVSRHGLFIQTDEPPPINHAVLLTVKLRGGPFETMATVVRRVTAMHEGPALGVGLKLFCLGAGAKDRWDRFVISFDNPTAQLPRRATKEADGAVFLIQPDNAADLLDFYQRNVAGRSTFYLSPAVRVIGAPVSVVLVHPDTHEEFAMAARVVEWNPDHPLRMGIRFEHIDRERRRAFRGFLGPIPGAGTLSMPDGSPLIAQERPRWHEYAYYSPKLAEAAAARAATAAAAAGTAHDEEVLILDDEVLDVIEGELAELPELQLIDKQELFDFTWKNDNPPEE